MLHNLRIRVPVLLLCACLCLQVFQAEAQTSISSNPMKWHKVTLTFIGANLCENSGPNPFTDYRLNVTFTKGSKSFMVPGFFMPGMGASCGNQWLVRFTPDETGVWNYTVSYRTGVNIAISDNPLGGSPVTSVQLDGTTGSFNVLPSNKTGKDFRAKGMLHCVNDHYLEFAETGERYIKGGANSPENILAYYEFDQTHDLGGLNTPGLTNGLHRFDPHVQDWKTGDPTWSGGRGKGIIGMLNYLASQGINSLYFLTYNIDGGDGQDVWPWLSHNERLKFDCSKLEQWEIVFSHMDSLGIQMHLVTQERENDQVLGGNSQLNNIRKLYYRELIARFSHHLALQWNIGEENDNTDAERAQFAQYIRNLDPYNHPIVVHTQNNNAGTFYDDILTNPAWLQYFEGTSIQGEAINYNNWTIQLRKETELAGKKWSIAQDEQVPPVMPDGSNFDELRKNALWGNLMGGGSGIEWYFGYNGNFGDVQSENMRVVEPLWQQTRHALDFFQTYLPFSEMKPNNNLISGMGNYCFAKEGRVYAVYLKNGTTTPAVLSITHLGNYSVKWYHPKTGGSLKNGSVQSMQILNAGSYSIGQPPYSPQDDWVALVQATSVSQTICAGDSILLGGAFRKTAGVYPNGNDVVYLTVEPCNVPCLLEVQGLTLVFEGSSGVIGPLTNGLVINKDTLCRFNIRADVCHDVVKSVKFKMNGVIFRTESTAPFALAGDNPAGNYNVWIPNTGVHTISVNPYSGTGGTGSSGPAYTITFTIVDGPNANTACDSPPIMDCNGNINGTASVDTCGICAGGLTGITPNTCNTNCNDNNPCTNDTRVNGVCAFTPIVCNDNIACTNDACNNGQCAFTPKVCNDNTPCTNDACNNGLCVFTPKVCNDNNPCTNDACNNGLCVFTPKVCNDNDACTTDACNNGQCVFTPKVCNDNSSCTTDNCANGICVYTPNICNDNNSCTSDNCVNGQCVFTPTITCNDNSSCTSDNCVNGQCVFVPIVCNDNNSCTADLCVNGQCQFTATTTCNDNNLCTIDNCANGQCQFTPIICNDNSSCTSDNCVNGQCIHTPTVTCNDNNPCTNDNCANGQCVYVPILCNDDNICTSDNCVNGQCVYTPSSICVDNDACTTDGCVNGICTFLRITCNDNNACTTDGCDYATGCKYTPMVCNDNNACTVDACNNGQCSSTPKNCNDNNACTTDACNNGTCSYTAMTCDDRNACTTDACSNGQCTFTPSVCNDGNSCTYDVCDNGACVFPADPNCNQCANIVCNDNNACTIDTCVNGNCLRTPKSCNDANACSFDMCSNGNCYHFPVSGCGVPCPNGLSCNDNNACTEDYCSSNGRCVNLNINCADDNACTSDGCLSGSCVHQNTCLDVCYGVNCNDNNPCTTDNCNNGQCVSTPTVCNDFNPCTNDNCSNGQCISTPMVCNDNNACTADLCSNGQCTFTPLVCNDNNACTADNCANGQCTFTPTNCNDNNACTTDACSNGQCVHTSISCNDGNACTTDACSNGQCIFTPLNCNDNNACTNDQCQLGQCKNIPIDCNDNNNCTADNCSNGVCTYRNICSPANQCVGVVCNDANACTTDTCINGTCNYLSLCSDGNGCTLDVASLSGVCQRTPFVLEPAYIKAINPARSWRKLKIGYDPVSFWTPKQNVIAGGNNMLCITLRTHGPVNWSAVQFRTVAANLIVMGNYIQGDICPGVWTKVCIPLSDFPAPNFNGISYIEFPYSFGADAFEIDILKIEFTGGTSPFVWFGDEQTDNVHDGESGSPSALLAEVIYGDICNAAAKTTETETVSAIEAGNLRVYPVPFNNLLQLDVNAVANGTARVSLVNVIGQTVQVETVEFTEGANQLELHIRSELASGIYFLRFESEELSETVKIIKAD